MSIVRESINFERGLDPKKAMGLGSRMLEMIRNIHDNHYSASWDYFGRQEEKAIFALKGMLMKIYFDKEDPSKAFTENCQKMNCTVEQMDLIQTLLEREFSIEVKYLGPDGKIF